MATVGHLVLPLLAWLRFRPNRQALAISLFFAVLPDADVIASFLLTGNLFALHRGPTHSLLFACIPLVFFALTMRRELIWGFLGALSHPLIDVIDTHGAPLLWPLSNEMFSLDLGRSTSSGDLSLAGILAPGAFLADKLLLALLIVSLAYHSCRWCRDSLKRRRQKAAETWVARHHPETQSGPNQPGVG